MAQLVQWINTKRQPTASESTFLYEVASYWIETIGTPRGNDQTDVAEIQTWLDNFAWKKIDELNAEAKSWAYIIIIIAIVFILLPIRTLLNRCVVDDDAEVEDVKYEDRMPFFSTDYDTQNPLTAKKGKLRMLETKIKNCKDDDQKA